MKKIFWPLLSVSLMTSVLLLSCKNHTEEEPDPGFKLTDTMMSRITLDTARKETVKTEMRFSGKITPEDNKMTNVYPIVAGFVTKLTVSLGDYVKKGQTLAVIKSTDIADFEKQKRDAENNLSVANKKLKTAKELNESKLNTQKDVLDAQKDVDDAQSELNRVNEVYNIYHVKEGSFYDVIAPISGFVVDKKINADMQLPASFNESIFTIAQIDEVFVTANVYETDIPSLSINMPAEVEMLSYPNKRLLGKVDKILNVLDPDTKTMKIRIKLPNPGYALKPEMAAIVYIDRNEQEQKTSIPSDAVIFDKSKNYVMVFHRRDSIETRMIEPLRTTGKTTFLESGLQPGEQIISKNALLVYDALND